MDKFQALKAQKQMYMDKKVKIGFSLYEITGNVHEISNDNFHLINAEVRSFRPGEEDSFFNCQAISVSRTCIFIGIVG